MDKAWSKLRCCNSFTGSLILASFFALGMSLYRYIDTDSQRYWFLAWNLVLAWLPLIFAWALYKRAPKGLYWSWINLALIALWLLFLPNAFYLVTDFIHLHPTGEIALIYDVVLMASYTFCGFALGYSSLYFIHKRVMQRFGNLSYLMVGAVLLLCGFAIYLGRYLRWNSWDIITNPSDLIFDVSSRIAAPGEHIFTFATTLLFFVFLSVNYFVIFMAIDTVGHKAKLKAK